jgi:carbon storage regulator CsrA
MEHKSMTPKQTKTVYLPADDDAGNVVVGRKPGEQIVIGESVIVRVNEITANHVRLSVIAPRDISIRRAELVPVDPAA